MQTRDAAALRARAWRGRALRAGRRLRWPLVALLAGVLGLPGACAGLPTGSSLPAISEGALGPGEAATPALDQAVRPTVALVMKTLTNPFFVEMERGARRAEAELGVNLIVRTGSQETSIDQQIALVEELVAVGVDAIVIAPGSSTELIPALVRAQQQGVAVVNIDNRLDPALSAAKGLTGVPFISVDNAEGAYLSAQALVQATGPAAEVALLEGIRSAQNARDRRRGALAAFAEHPNVRVVASETANWKIDEAYQVTGAILDRHPQIRGIFAANDMMALGALKCLADRGIAHVKVAGFDALEPARAAVKAGKLVATIDQRADQQGYLGVQYAVRLMRGEQLPAETLVEVQLIHGED